jgi:hypothetical protein
MMTDYLPRTSDYFPKTKRGHGSIHPRPRVLKDGTLIGQHRRPCVDPTCILNAPNSKNLHHDQKANREEWEKSVGLDCR